MAKRLITVNDILAGHVSLDVACLDLHLSHRLRVSRTRKGFDVGRASGLGAVWAMEVGPTEPPAGAPPPRVPSIHMLSMR
jgi:hypothetical protein